MSRAPSNRDRESNATLDLMYAQQEAADATADRLIDTAVIAALIECNAVPQSGQVMEITLHPAKFMEQFHAYYFDRTINEDGSRTYKLYLRSDVELRRPG